MADLNQRFNTYVKTLRNTNESGQPTQTLDSTRSTAQDQPTVRSNAAAKKQDLNTDYFLVIP